MSNVQVQDGSGQIAAEAKLVRSKAEVFWDRVLPAVLSAALLGVITAALLLWRNDTVQDRELDDHGEKLEELSATDAGAASRFYGFSDALKDLARQAEIDRAQDEQLRAFNAWQDSQREQSARMLALMEKWDVQVDANSRDLRSMFDRIARLEERADRAAGGGPQ